MRDPYDHLSHPAPASAVERIATRWGVKREHGTRVWFELAAPAPSA